MKYTVFYQEDSKIKKVILSKKQLEENKLPENIIKIKKRFTLLAWDLHLNKTVPEKKLKNVFYELSVMLESKILLNEALEILIKNEKNINTKEFLKALNSSFSSTGNLNVVLKKFKVPVLVKSFFTIIYESGDSISNIKILSQILSENYEIKKEFKKVMFYPLILLISFILALIGIFKFVVPKFEVMFTQYSMELSIWTRTLFFVKDIYENYLLLIVFLISLVSFLFIYIYRKFSKFRYFVCYIIAKKLWLISDIYMAKVFYEFFFSMENLLKNRYKFHRCLTKSKVLIENYYLLDRITQIENLLKSGKSIEFSMSQSKLFDELVLSLIRTGEISNSLELMISEIKNIYIKRFNDRLKLFSLAIEPIFFMIIMILIVWIILAIFVPLWSIGDMLKI
ncbi:MAG: type II secretion system F family protein [Halarcobacter sp.]